MTAIIPYKEIKQKWLDLGYNTGRTFELYIDSPFCVRACKYCIYTPIVTPIGSDEYNEYYKKTLPREIDKFREVLEKYKFESAYFGGGTSSYMTTEVMEEIFSSIPNFKEIPYKLFEAHPTFLNNDKIDILEKYNFTNISIGVQSFDRELVEGQNRVYNSKEKIKSVVDYAKSKGMRINCDLLTFMTRNPEYDLPILEKDLETMDWVNPSLIDLYPMHGTYDIQEYPIEQIKELRKIVLKFLFKHKRWNLRGEKLTLDPQDIEKLTIRNYVLTTLTEEELNNTCQYDSSGGEHIPDNQNVLALGCSSVRETYSYFGQDYVYYNQTDNNVDIRYAETNIEFRNKGGRN